MIGLGLVSYGRPDYRAQALAAIHTHLDPVLDHLVVVEDVAPVSVAKNRALRELLDAGCDWLFISEDDVVVDSAEAIHGYIRACKASGFGHLMFHAHGQGNAGGPTLIDGPITLWPNYIGAWSIYSRKSLETCGLMDEEFYNAWEHVEHTLRLSLAGFTPPWRGAADATGSEAWLHEIPGAIDNTSIPRPGRPEHIHRGQEHWLATHPETFRLLFP